MDPLDLDPVAAAPSGPLPTPAGPVQLVDQSGAVHSFDPSQVPTAIQMGYQQATPENIAAIANQKRYSSAAGTLKAGALGLGEGATMGLSTAGLVSKGWITPEDAQGYEGANPGTHMLGQLGGTVAALAAAGPLEGALGEGAATAINPVSAASKLGQKITTAVLGAEPAAAEGVLGYAKQLGLGALGSSVEGALYGAGNTVTEAALNPPNGDYGALGEHLAANMGIGALLGGGFSMAGHLAGSAAGKLGAMADGAATEDLPKAGFFGHTAEAVATAAPGAPVGTIDGLAHAASTVPEADFPAFKSSAVQALQDDLGELKASVKQAGKLGEPGDAMAGLPAEVVAPKVQTELQDAYLARADDATQHPITHELMEHHADLQAEIANSKTAPEIYEAIEKAAADLQTMGETRLSQKLSGVLQIPSIWGDEATSLAKLHTLTGGMKEAIAELPTTSGKLGAMIDELREGASPAAQALKASIEGAPEFHAALKAALENSAGGGEAPLSLLAKSHAGQAVRGIQGQVMSGTILANAAVKGVSALFHGHPGAAGLGAALWLGKKFLESNKGAALVAAERVLNASSNAASVGMKGALAGTIAAFTAKIPAHEDTLKMGGELAKLDNPQNMVDHVHELTGGLANVAPQTAAAMSQTAIMQLNFLKSKLPNMPSPNSLNTKPLPPSGGALAKFGRYLGAVHDPVGTLTAQLGRGYVQPEVMETMQTVYPKLTAQLQEKAVEALSSAKSPESIPFATRTAFGKFIGTPIDRQSPQAFAANQAAMQPEASQGPTGSPKSGGVTLASRMTPGSQRTSLPKA